jgi:hypothetical protein
MLSFVRDRWDLAPYDDPALRGALAAFGDRTRLRGGQVLLQPWVVGRSQTTAITALDHDAEFVAGIEGELGATCAPSATPGALAACVKAHGRSVYDVRLTMAEQATREWNAALAHVEPDRAAALLGVPLESIAGLRDRRRGFKCNRPDAETPSDAALVARFGALANGQSYFIPFSPLQPDKSIDRAPADWWTDDLVGGAFVDALRDVPTFVTDGKLDLVAPLRALPAALGAVLGRGSATRGANGIDVVLDDGARRSIAVGVYPDAGHMITIDEPAAFARDVAAWTNANVRTP